MRFYIFSIVLTAIVSLGPHFSSGQVDLNYYLPHSTLYNKDISTPESELGFQIGDWHVSHDKLVNYLKILANESERVGIEEYGRTHENRPLVLLTITSPENHKNLEELRQQHLKLSDPDRSSDLKIEEMPVVVWMGYSVHGNEPSGSNAALIMAYYLASAENEEVEAMLKNTIILLDPAQNPDGLQKFSSWVNSHKSKNLVTDPNSVEFNEPAPLSRFNHYGFDLNRDWLSVQLPESQGKIKKFHDWKPNILTDHHEMSTLSTFFFQPGVPSRNHPLTPKRNFELTDEIASYHAEALDQIGSFYFTKENYDDFFYGKVSTYPDIQGSIGILFEQASSRGHAQKSGNNILTFPFTIRNQVATSFSTLKASNELKNELLTYQKSFYSEAIKAATNDPVKAFVFTAGKDQSKLTHFNEILLQHKIRIFKLNRDLQVKDKTFMKDNSFIIPLKQPQYKLIQAFFEKRTDFKDSIFYDISSWTYPLAFNLDYEALDKRTFNENLMGEEITEARFPVGEVIGGKSSYAYVFEWYDYYAPRTLNKLLEKGIKVKVATQPFKTSDEITFENGSIIIPVSRQDIDADELFSIIETVSNEDGIRFHALTSGLQEKSSLGSNSFKNLRLPKILLVTGEGINSSDAGEIWHLLDQRFGMNPNLVSMGTLNKISLDQYNTLILVDGKYHSMSPIPRDKINSWLVKGGTIISFQGGAKWLADIGLSRQKFKTENSENTNKNSSYGDFSNTEDAQLIRGAIFEAKLDLSHPIGYGYEKPTLSSFRNSRYFLELPSKAASSPLLYSKEPLQSGYVSIQNLEKVKDSAIIGTTAVGEGLIISFTDNPIFRAFWFGTNKLFLNSLFFSDIINKNTAR